MNNTIYLYHRLMFKLKVIIYFKNYNLRYVLQHKLFFLFLIKRVYLKILKLLDLDLNKFQFRGRQLVVKVLCLDPIDIKKAIGKQVKWTISNDCQDEDKIIIFYSPKLEFIKTNFQIIHNITWLYLLVIFHCIVTF